MTRRRKLSQDKLAPHQKRWLSARKLANPGIIILPGYEVSSFDSHRQAQTHLRADHLRPLEHLLPQREPVLGPGLRRRCRCHRLRLGEGLCGLGGHEPVHQRLAAHFWLAEARPGFRLADGSSLGAQADSEPM
jgi:hypothetical protein